MFYTTLNGNTEVAEVKVVFKHDKRDITHLNKDDKFVVQKHPFKTTCVIIATNDNTQISSGVAACDPRDTFVYELGRKMSLTRALVSSGLKEQDRKLVWDTYFGNKK